MPIPAERGKKPELVQAPIVKTLGEYDFPAIGKIIGKKFGIQSDGKLYGYATRMVDIYNLELKRANDFVTEMEIVSLDGSIHQEPSLNVSFDIRSKVIEYPDGHTDIIVSDLYAKPSIHMDWLVYTYVTFDGNGSLSHTKGIKVLGEKSVFTPTEQAALEMARDKEEQSRVELAKIRAEAQSRF